jgi:putative flippase GtrA
MKIVRYCLVGGISATIDIGLFTIFAYCFKLPWAIVSVITFIIATLTNYLLSIKYIFKSGSRYKKNHEILGIFLISSLALLLNQIFLYLFIEKINLDLIISKCLTISLLFLWNYYGRKKIIFSVRDKAL